MIIFVGNLSFEANESDVKKLFEGFGSVASVVILRRKEKKAPKSRGFGFVEMPDEQQALAAIAALNDKEFMGRVLDIEPARPKTEAQPESKLKDKRPSKVRVEAQQYSREERKEKGTWFSPVFDKPISSKGRRGRPSGLPLALKDKRGRPSGLPGTYMGGRRSHSYKKRLELAGIQEEVKPRKTFQDNPGRWRKRKDQVKPWQKSSGGEHKPWDKTGGEARPLKKTEGDRPQKSRFKGRKNPGGYKK